MRCHWLITFTSLVACSSAATTPGGPGSDVHPFPPEPRTAASTPAPATNEPSSDRKRIVAMGCPAVSIKHQSGETNQAKLCERIAFNIGLCETWASGVTSDMERCDAVVVEDQRRLEVEAECMTWDIPPEKVEPLFEAAFNCLMYETPYGWAAHTCSRTIPCLRQIGFQWTPHPGW